MKSTIVLHIIMFLIIGYFGINVKTKHFSLYVPSFSEIFTSTMD